MSALEPGMAVTESIRLVRKLGEGGMGSVWVAHHAKLRSDVAVKFLAPGLAGDPAAAQRLANEAAAVARARSPHIVQILDHGALPDGQPYIVMELLEGEDLDARLRRERTLTLGETARVVAQVAKALGRAHERGIVHRDVKPANLFLCDVGGAEAFVKVLDFGVAKGEAVAGDLRTASGAIVGTPSYMSPEQLVASSRVDHRADLWALAAVAFRALVGAPPFRGETIGALALEMHTGATPSACARVPALPAPVDAWFARAFQREPAARFGSAAEMASALLEIAGAAPDPGLRSGGGDGGRAAPGTRAAEVEGADPRGEAIGPEGPRGDLATTQVAPPTLFARTPLAASARAERRAPGGPSWVLGGIGAAAVAVVSVAAVVASGARARAVVAAEASPPPTTTGNPNPSEVPSPVASGPGEVFSKGDAAPARATEASAVPRARPSAPRGVPLAASARRGVAAPEPRPGVLERDIE